MGSTGRSWTSLRLSMNWEPSLFQPTWSRGRRRDRKGTVLRRRSLSLRACSGGLPRCRPFKLTYHPILTGLLRTVLSRCGQSRDEQGRRTPRDATAACIPMASFHWGTACLLALILSLGPDCSWKFRSSPSPLHFPLEEKGPGQQPLASPASAAAL